ncbi:MAG: sodium:solute symporter [Thermogemmatispora sp.]|uniref:Sodium:solute symporter n=1 Tax=Thermogemmatispora aurantia TaxID=2045279 RepID=A0A5J4JXS5_9CHLR|nr:MULTISPECIES: sodium:solute symporter [Thermogemmatispora]MBE3564570.1 sodium:solute symporter [Thermogemmatispora sp.]GER82108.1 sodium:solute symporter [Thermogemmatispora aurantia]
MVNVVALSVFIVFFILVTVLGFVAARWRRGDLSLLNEWGLAGRRFGTVITWFLLGGDLYTAYTFVAVPGLMFNSGATGFFAVPYTIVAYPLVYLLMPRFWSVARKHGYITASDFVRDRFGSSTLALVVAFTGILATMPYIALQMFGIEVSIAQMGVPVEAALIIAFLILAAYTYTSGLRAPAMIALVKDLMIFTVMIAAIIVIPIKLGGFGNIFAAAHTKHLSAIAQGTTFRDLLTTPQAQLAYATLALGSALALFLYPHAMTGVLSSSSRQVVKRNAALLPLYSLMLGLLALLGYMAIAAGTGVTSQPAFHNYKANGAVPSLMSWAFPDWFAGFAFAAISIGALVPAAVMSIAAANLFTRNIYKEYFRPNCSDREESTVAKVVSLVVKFGALLFILLVPATNIINFQLLGGVWIIQTLPPVFLGLYTNWMHRWAMIIGWAGGMIAGTWMAVANNFASSVFTISLGNVKIAAYIAVYSLLLNLVLTLILTPVFRALGVPSGKDNTQPSDYEEEGLAALPKEPLMEELA